MKRNCPGNTGRGAVMDRDPSTCLAKRKSASSLGGDDVGVRASATVVRSAEIHVGQI
jgi:hypothetical protein